MQLMLCTDCDAVSVPETVLEGSDATELASWLCLGIPGWIYCYWRHIERRKVCRLCGGESVIREAKRSRRLEDRDERIALDAQQPTAPPPWPRAWANPRDRLRHGGVGALLLWTFGISLVVAVTTPSSALSARFAALAAAGFSAWLLFQTARTARNRAPRCHAWDDHGRRLTVEWQRTG